MALELCSENCGPRISFSHDFSQSDFIPVEQHPIRSKSSGLNSSIDFDFNVSESLNLEESSSAAELFSDGRILPAEIKKKQVPLKQSLTTQSPSPNPSLNPSYSTCNNESNGKNLRKESTKESKYLNDEVCEKQSSNSKSFWSFKRSSSCGSGYGRSLCPLPLLSRSNSTGSSTSSVNNKRNSLSKEGISTVKSNSQKLSSTRLSNSSGSNSYLKPPLNKSYGSHGHSVRVNPVLNVPPANLFGLSSIFSNKSKKK